MDCPLLSTTDSQEPAATPGDVAVRGLLAVSRLLAGTTDGSAPDVHAAVLREARVCFQPRGVVLLAQEPGRRLRVICGDVPDGLRGVLLDLDAQPAVAELLSRRLSLVRLDGDQARAIPPLGTPTTAQAAVLLLLLRAPDGFGDAVLVVTDPSGPAASEVATAFGDAAAAALERVRAHEEHERQAAQQRALTRAAKTLNGSLDLDTVLSRICHEAATILGCDVATLYRGTMEEGLTVAAVHGMPPESVGYRLPTGAGLAGKVLVQGRAMLTNDYARVAELPPGAPHPQAISAMGAPMAWDGHPRGVLTVGYTDSREVTQQDLSVLETFAELAATACANASAHAGIVHIARTDGLTGCLNHAALHDSLRREIERATRAGAAPLSLVLVDLDDFKAVNDAHGHLAGDEVLRRAGHALRHATRPYDLAARYGGDEFALITVEADEEDAVEIGRRALARMDTAIREFLPPGGSPGTAGVAQWEPGETVGELVARADRALLYAKQQGARGQVVAFSGVADHFRPGRFARTDRRAGATPPGQAPAERGWPGDRLDERLRKRTRQLALANALGARLAAMTDPEDILHATVEELHRAFGFFCVRLVRAGDDGGAEAVAVRGDPFAGVADQPGCRPTDPGLIGRCLSTRRPAVSHDDVRADLAVPLWAGDELWGAITVEQRAAGAFHDDDVMLVQTVAALLGSALRSALLYARLESAYLGTAEALAAALEAKDAYTVEHARSISERAEQVGRELGLADGALRDLRLAAVFHDIGKVAIPEAILHKPGPLTAEERAVVERHSLAGEQILSPVPALEEVRRLVRHEHEHYDGGGYPDGLAAGAIPLGSRIILACDALHAMTSDRPYRSAMSLQGAVGELRRQAGRQFDPEVVDALLGVLARTGVTLDEPG